MKVLFVDHPEGDMLAATVYLGLCQEIGAENVVDWPYKPSYHGQTDTGYTQPNGNPGMTAPFSWFPAQPGGRWEGNDVAARIGEFDVVILASPRKNNDEALSWLIGRVGRGALRRLVMIDGEDYEQIRWDFIQRFLPSVYFKRELVTNPYNPHGSFQVGDVRVLSCPFASPVPVLEPVEKTMDVEFFGGGNYPGGRGPIDEALSRAFGSRYGGNRMLDWNGYIQAMCRSKIAIGTRGWGWDALRLWEIPSCPGTLMVRDRTPLIQVHAFVDDDTCAFFNDVNHLVDTCRGYLSDEPRRLRVANKGNLHLRNNHTAKERARYILSEAIR